MQYDLQDIVKLTNDWGVSLPPMEEFWGLGDLTALRQDDEGRFYRSNYERGPLLYALVAKYRPQTVLEFGTGRGYGTLCMARAMYEHNIQGRIYSIDVLTPESIINWSIKRHDAFSPTIEKLTWNDVWQASVPEQWLSYIELLNGDSAVVMRDYKGPKINFAFIDAGHNIDAVRHDFYATLRHVDMVFTILFDDYADDESFGVKSLIDKEVKPYFDVNFFQTYRRYFDTVNEFEKAIYKMGLVNSKSLKKPLPQVYDFDAQERFIYYYSQQQNSHLFRRLWKMPRQLIRQILQRSLLKKS